MTNFSESAEYIQKPVNSVKFQLDNGGPFVWWLHPSTNMTHRPDNSGSAKTVVSCPRPNTCPFMVRAHLIRLHSHGPFAHSSKQDVQSEGEELCLPINLAHITIPFPLKFPRDSMHFISIRLVLCTSENLNKQSNYQEVKMNPHQIYPLTQNWVMSA